MRLVALLTAALLLSPAAPSYAAGEPVPAGGGCGIISGPAPDDPKNRIAGFVHGRVVVGDFAGTAGYPASVTLTCSVQVGRYHPDDPDDATTTGSGVNAAVALPEPFDVAKPGEWEWIGLCSRVDVTDAEGTRTFWKDYDNGMWVSWPTCDDGVQCLAIGPGCMWELAMLEWLLERSEPKVCAAFVALAPGIPGTVDIEPDGDLYVAGEWIWDCPPYFT